MKNKIKFLGIAALALVVTFGFLACGDAVDENTTVTITEPDLGWIVGEVLEAVVEPSGKYDYQWYNGTEKATGESNKEKYTPTVPGTYKVIINESKDDKLESAQVEVFAIPLGSYLMDSDMNGYNGLVIVDADGDNPTKQVVDELIVLAKNSFKLTVYLNDESDKPHKTQSKGDGDFWNFTIVKWYKIDGVQSANGSVKYPNGFKLDIATITESGGYSTSANAIYIYANSALSEFIRTAGATADSYTPKADFVYDATKSNTSKGKPENGRKYVKQ